MSSSIKLSELFAIGQFCLAHADWCSAMYTYVQQQECIHHYHIQEVPEHPVALLYGPSGKAEYVVKGFGSAHELICEMEALRKIKALTKHLPGYNGKLLEIKTKSKSVVVSKSKSMIIRNKNTGRIEPIYGKDLKINMSVPYSNDIQSSVLLKHFKK